MNANKVKKSYVKSVLAGAASAAVIAFASAPAAAQATETVEFDIPAQDLSAALNAYGRQSGKEIAFSPDAVKGKRLTVALRGDYAPDAALDKILSDTGLEHRMSDADIIVVSDPGAKRAEAENNQGYFRVAQLDQEDSGDVARVSDRGASDDDEDAQDVVVVTGTRIKGVKDQFSPVTQIDREEMDLSGFSNVSDVIESLPQNFGGGVTINTSQADSGDGPGGAGVNLRGLGNAATLVLLNGRRVAGGGVTGQFVDISAIPASAIERVEVVTDGASAIYGSDAVAGVVNIILRDDFNGAESRLNVGTITDGGGDFLKVAQTLGWSGDRAHAMVTYEFSDEEELDAQQKDFAVNASDPTWLLPFTQKHSVLTSAGAELTDRIKLSADAYFNDRKSKQFTSIDTVTTFLQAFQRTEVQQYGGALGLDFALSNDWEANLSGSFSKSEFSSYNIRTTSNSGEDRSAVTEVLSFDGSVGGPLFSISDDPVRGVIGGHYRSERADVLSVRFPTPEVLVDSDKSRDIFAAFGEIFAPIVTDGNRLPGVESLALSAAVRYEHYSDVGSSLDPKVGLSWSPVSGLNLRGTYSTSFRAPRLDQLVDSIGAGILNLYVDPMGAEFVGFVVSGNREDLDPETSRTWTAGFDFSPPTLDGVLLRGTYFNTVFSDQVGSPSISLDGSFRFIDFTGIPQPGVSQADIQDFCARATFGCTNFSDFFPSLGMLTFADAEVLLDTRFQNLSESKVAGFDFEGSYDFASAVGDWRFSVAGTLLTTFEQQIAPAAPVNDLLNTFGNPVDLRLRGGVQWRTDAITTAVYVNHVGDYIDDENPTGDVPIDSFTTIDATFRLDLGALGDNPLTEGATISFSVLNILNEDPPFINSSPARFATFDRANADPAGRKIGLLLTKRW